MSFNDGVEDIPADVSCRACPGKTQINGQVSEIPITRGVSLQAFPHMNILIGAVVVCQVFESRCQPDRCLNEGRRNICPFFLSAQVDASSLEAL